MKGRAGYSLFEVLLAFVIMTIVLAALVPGQANLLSRTGLQEDRLLAFDYALSKAARLGAVTPTQIGVSEDVYRDWQVRTTITEAGSVGGGVDTLRVEITVSQVSGDHLASYQTLRAIP